MYVSIARDKKKQIQKTKHVVTKHQTVRGKDSLLTKTRRAEGAKRESKTKNRKKSAWPGHHTNGAAGGAQKPRHC